MMVATPDAICFVVHGRTHVYAALAAGAESGRPIVLLSAPGASAFAGPPWFAELARQGRKAFPAAVVTPMLDCGDRAAEVMVAFDCGLTDMIFSGHKEALRRLRAIGEGIGARVHDCRPDGFDLLNLKDPLRAARVQCGLSP